MNKYLCLIQFRLSLGNVDYIANNVIEAYLATNVYQFVFS